MYECYHCGHTVFEHEEQFGECRVYTWKDREEPTKCTCYHYETGSMLEQADGDCLSKDG